MKKITCLLLAIVFLLTGCEKKEKQDLPALEPDHYLYEVKDNEGNHLYLLGTMHVGPKEVPIDGLLKEAYDKSEVIAFEILFDISAEDTQNMNLALTKNPLTELEGKNEQFETVWKDLREVYPNISDGAKNFNAMYVLTLAQNIVFQELGLSSFYGVDLTLYQKAKTDGKTLKEIEGITSQIETIRQMGEKAPMLILVSLLDKADYVSSMETMVTAYANGDLGGEAFGDNDVEIDENSIPEKYRTGTLNDELKAYQDVLLYTRNDDMFKKAEELLKQNNAILAIGAGHVVGETGLAQQFKDAGYEVVRLEEVSK